MNPPVSPSTRILSGGVRALAHVLVGLESLGVLVLAAAVLLGLPIEGLIPDEPWKWAAVVSGTLIVAYLLGLIVDGVATSLWAAWVREDWGEGDLKAWARRRSDALHVPTNLDTWIAAQRWIWESELANREFGDLRLRMMLGKDTALNVGVAIIVCAVALFVDPVRETMVDAVGTPWWCTIAIVSVLTGATISWLQYRVATHSGSTEGPGFWQWSRTRSGCAAWGLMILSVLALAAFWVAAPGSLKGLPRVAWLAPATAFGPLLFFGFIHVRFTANALYHRMVRDAYEAGAPGERNS